MERLGYLMSASRLARLATRPTLPAASQARLAYPTPAVTLPGRGGESDAAPSQPDSTAHQAVTQPCSVAARARGVSPGLAEVRRGPPPRGEGRDPARLAGLGPRTRLATRRGCGSPAGAVRRPLLPPRPGPTARARRLIRRRTGDSEGRMSRPGCEQRPAPGSSASRGRPQSLLRKPGLRKEAGGRRPARAGGCLGMRPGRGRRTRPGRAADALLRRARFGAGGGPMLARLGRVGAARRKRGRHKLEQRPRSWSRAERRRACPTPTRRSASGPCADAGWGQGDERGGGLFAGLVAFCLGNFAAAVPRD
jgi:hypothetical protein